MRFFSGSTLNYCDRLATVVLDSAIASNAVSGAGSAEQLTREVF